MFRRVLRVPGRLLAVVLRLVGRALRPVGRLFGGRWGRVLRVVVVLALAAGGYFLFIPQTHVERSRLAKLVIDHTALSQVPAKAKLSEAINPSQSTFAATRNAAKRAPGATGMYAREWYVSSSGPPEAGVVLQMLPDTATARTVFAAEVKQLGTKPTLTQETPTNPKRFSVPGVAGSQGISWILDDASTSAHAPVGASYTVVYRVGRVVVSELMVTTSPARDTAAISADAKANAALVARLAPGISLVRTTWPFVASLVFAVVTVVVAAGAVLLPEWFGTQARRRRERHEEREQRRAREQYLARGRRTVRRQRAPAWSQPRRR